MKPFALDRSDQFRPSPRVMGGYHIQADEEGLKLGRRVAEYSWPKIEAYFDGTAKWARRASVSSVKC
ncbi:MAG TPA: hypothetical protein VHL59_16160 [Thermoanaerobaculia bacterium]|nr:hypothetical protein [Thermoanaerobaculia bacterium]